MIRSAGGAALALVLACCAGDDAADGPSEFPDDIAVVDAWTRPSPATVDNAALYVSLVNGSGVDDELIGATSERCALVQPHLTMIDDDGIASMAEAIGEQMEIPDQDRLEMEPNGLHLMCIGLTEPFVAGEEFEIELDFAERASLRSTVAVEQR